MYLINHLEYFQGIRFVIEKMEESKEGTNIYKMLGTLVTSAKKLDLSILTRSEKDSIKDRLKELMKMF